MDRLVGHLTTSHTNNGMANTSDEAGPSHEAMSTNKAGTSHEAMSTNKGTGS